MTTPYTYFGDLTGVESFLEQSYRKLISIAESQTTCLGLEEIEQAEEELRKIRKSMSRYKDLLDKHKTVALIKSEISQIN